MSRKPYEIYFGDIEVGFIDYWFLLSRGKFYLRSKLERDGKPIEEHELKRTVSVNHGRNVEYVSPTITLRPQQYWDLEGLYEDYQKDEIEKHHAKENRWNK